jgi:carbonic anhydrase
VTLPAAPARRLVVITCMDARLEPLRLLGLDLGDAHVLRNAGAVVTGDVLRSLAVSAAMMGTREALVIGHTDCGLERFTSDEVVERLPAGAPRLDFLPYANVDEAVRDGVRRIDESPLLPAGFTAAGCVYSLATGELLPL